MYIWFYTVFTVQKFYKYINIPIAPTFMFPIQTIGWVSFEEKGLPESDMKIQELHTNACFQAEQNTRAVLP